MRIVTGTGGALAGGAYPVRRGEAPGAQPRLAAQGQRAVPGWLDTELPSAVVDRLSVLLAADPGLADAVTAQLPAARKETARDLGIYGPPPHRSVITRPSGL
jgi:hypothetical protein